ncbi:hypothetical protein D9818_23390, partial [Salmonella enterica]|nr:hypothetical protein [Salmonella enterica]
NVKGFRFNHKKGCTFFVDYDDFMLKQLQDSATKLISLCNEYQKRHGKKINNLSGANFINHRGIVRIFSYCLIMF